MFFLPQEPLKRRQAKKLFELIVEKEGMAFLGWREVPVKPEILEMCIRDRAYEAHGGSHLSSTVGDAMLAVLQVYGYPALHGKTPSEIFGLVSSVWEEIVLQQEEDPIDVKLAPEVKKQNLLAKMFTAKERGPMRVAFIHDKTPAESGWTNSHEQGRLYVQRVFGDAIRTAAYCNAMELSRIHI